MNKPTIIVIGEANKPQPVKKPIEVKYLLANDRSFVRHSNLKGEGFQYIELICRRYIRNDIECPDLIFCYSDPERRHEGVMFLGKWNDGVLE